MPTDRSTPPAMRRRLGEWMAREEAHMAAYREKIANEARMHAGKRLRTPAVQALARLFDDDAVLRMGLARAIDEALEAGRTPGYASIGELMTVIDHLMTYTPPFSESSLIVCPVNAFLDWPMCMPSGHAVFRDAAVNAHLKQVLNVWCDFLGGPQSRTHLDTSTPDGWFCDDHAAPLARAFIGRHAHPRYLDRQPPGGVRMHDDGRLRRKPVRQRMFELVDALRTVWRHRHRRTTPSSNVTTKITTKM